MIKTIKNLLGLNNNNKVYFMESYKEGNTITIKINANNIIVTLSAIKNYNGNYYFKMHTSNGILIIKDNYTINDLLNFKSETNKIYVNCLADKERTCLHSAIDLIIDRMYFIY